jgi:hypothetical protein
MLISHCGFPHHNGLKVLTSSLIHELANEGPNNSWIPMINIVFQCIGPSV